MILHILLDDKFGDYMINQFNRVNKTINYFLVVSSKSEMSYIKSDFDNVRSVEKGEIFSFIDDNINNIRAIIFHGLNEEYKWQLIDRYHDKVKLHWFFWGSDGYMLPSMRKGLLKSRTRKLKIQKTKISFWMYKVLNNEGFFNWLYLTFRKLLRKEKLYFQKFENALLKLSSISAIPDDYEKIKAATGITAFNFPVNIGSIDSILIDKKFFEKEEVGDNIIVGNSISIENNHLDAFFTLKNFELFDRKIIVPLSYGESFKGLKDQLISEGQKSFSLKNFFPIIDFMDRKDYNRLICNCSVAILNHNKQHAWGNILTFLYIGLKVFLNEKNPLYTYLTNLEIVVFEMNSLSQANIDSKLPFRLVKHNRSVLNANFGADKVFQQTTLLIDELIA
tara:strand:+ start:2062 stop:3237 length:1176 start_codon:yes stop_codon:yes gene_type:complete